MKFAALLLCLLCCDSCCAQTVCNALEVVNRQRVARGVYPLLPAADLQYQAEIESVERAARGITGHLPNGVAPGRAEGVGWRGGADPWGEQFNTCFHTLSKRRWQAGAGYTTKYRYAGAAAAVSPSGRTYYVLILR